MNQRQLNERITRYALAFIAAFLAAAGLGILLWVTATVPQCFWGLVIGIGGMALAQTRFMRRITDRVLQEFYRRHPLPGDSVEPPKNEEDPGRSPQVMDDIL